MFFSKKVYNASKTRFEFINLTHDIKLALQESGAKKGLINILSTLGTVGITLLEDDEYIKKNLVQSVQFDPLKNLTEDEMPLPSQTEKLKRRSGAGASEGHVMASRLGTSLTIPFQDSKLLISPFSHCFAIDFDSTTGRREFVISIQGE